MLNVREGDRPSSIETFLVGLQNRIPALDQAFDILFERMDHEVRIRFGASRSLDQALNKIHGDWFEFLLSIAAFNAHIADKSDFLAVELPNKNRYDCESLYKPHYSEFIADLRIKVEEAASVVLISSNPDFVVLRASRARADENLAETALEEFNADVLAQLRSRYLSYHQQCEFEDIAAYLGAKFTLKPDRRLQLAHEGSLMKALYVHLQTREWNLSPSGIRYYAATTHASDADLRGLQTVATHSITTVTSSPQRAVDKVFVINTLKGAIEMFQEIYRLCSMSTDDRARALRNRAIEAIS